jgi:hypothetical protein
VQRDTKEVLAELVEKLKEKLDPKKVAATSAGEKQQSGELRPNLDRLTVGVDLGDQGSHYCILGLEGETLAEGTVADDAGGLGQLFPRVEWVKPQLSSTTVMMLTSAAPWRRCTLARTRNFRISQQANPPGATLGRDQPDSPEGATVGASTDHETHSARGSKPSTNSFGGTQPGQPNRGGPFAREAGLYRGGGW